MVFISGTAFSAMSVPNFYIILFLCCRIAVTEMLDFGSYRDFKDFKPFVFNSLLFSVK